jgi:hypothetical protein
MKLSANTCLFLLLLAVVVLLGGGCATDDPENLSVRPWNAPNNNGASNGMLDNISNQHQ